MKLERPVVDAVRGAAPAHPRKRSIETEIIPRVSDRPVATVNSAAVGSSPCVLDPGTDLRAAIESVTIRRTTLEILLAEGGNLRIGSWVIPWTPPSPYRRREIIQGEGGRSWLAGIDSEDPHHNLRSTPQKQ
jgi:hypothetical protein